MPITDSPGSAELAGSGRVPSARQHDADGMLRAVRAGAARLHARRHRALPHTAHSQRVQDQGKYGGLVAELNCSGVSSQMKVAKKLIGIVYWCNLMELRTCKKPREIKN